MNLPSAFALLACLVTLSDFTQVRSAESFSDPGFVSELVTTLPAYAPVGVTWSPDGRMFIWQKNGIVKIFHDGNLHSMPFLDFSAKVNVFNDNGMTSIAFDPDFANNGYVYLSYAYEEGGDPNSAAPKIARLTRVTANPADPDVMLSGSEVIILDNIPDSEGAHNIGTIRFAPGGTIFLGVGDGASPGFVDSNAYGAQDLDNIRGKILRIWPDGTAPTDNPFYDGTDSIRSKIWCYGVRNPYRFSLHPVTKVPYIADVGWNEWEEIGLGVRGGNLGWPCYEGNAVRADYQALGFSCPDPSTLVFPLHSYSHSSGDLSQGGTCLVGGDFYTGTQYPDAYRTNYFYMDYSGNWIHRMVLDDSGNFVNALPFATGLSGPTCLEQGPDGFLYLANLNSGQIRRIRFNGPLAVASATPDYGYSPLQVAFSSDGSTNTSGGTSTFSWSFGDGVTSTLPNPIHTYAYTGVTNYTASLTVKNAASQTASTEVAITVGSLPPIPTISVPADGASYFPGQTVAFQGAATDPDQGVIGPAALKWTVLLHHNDHVHVVYGSTGNQGNFAVADHGSIGTFSYEIVLTASDDSGLEKSTSVNLPVILDAVAPSVPTSLTAMAASSSQINLSWNAATDNGAVEEYHVERSLGSGSTTYVSIGSTIGTTYIDTGLQPQTVYNYRVTAVDVSANQGDSSTVSSATTLALPPPPPGLVAAYAFDEGVGASVGDVSGNGNNGSIGSATWTTSGKYGRALTFDGASARVTVPDSNSLDLTTGMTLEAWVNPTAVGGWRDVIYKSPSDTYYLMGSSDNSTPAVGGTFAATAARGPTSLPLNTWTHVAGTYDGATLRLYVNGVQVSSRAQTGPISVSTGALTIGSDALYGQYFAGMIDEVRIYNRALSVVEIQSDMNTPVGGSPPVNTAPTISDITDRAINEDANTGAIGFTVGDGQTAAGSLTVSGSSGNPTLVPNGNIVFGGSGANRTVTVSPAAGQSGTAVITVVVSDGSLTAIDAFVLTVNAASATPVFPVKYSANGRCLVDQNGRPFPIMGRTAWFVLSLSVGDYQSFVDDTAARGYSAIELHVLNHDPRGNNPPFNGNDDAPFLQRLDGTSWNGLLSGSAPDFTTPNEAYWSFVDGFLAYCESKGVLVFLFPAYVGFGGGEQGWMQEMVANGDAKMEAYGAWIAARYEDQKNLVWMMGGDFGTPPYVFNSAQTSVEDALLTGLESVQGQQSVFFSAEWTFESIATDQTTFGPSMTLNGVYSFSGDVNTHGRRAYAHDPIEPAFLLEEPYDEEGADGNGANLAATQPVRRFQWWGWLSTIGGYISGNGYVWPFRSDNATVDWRNHLDTQGARDMARLNSFIGSIAWYKLVPSDLDGMRTLITAGGSSDNQDDYVTAAATPDGTLLVAYVPPDHNGPITVDMGAMSGPTRARWYDPTSAAYTDIGTELSNTGTRTFTIPGNNSVGENDWVLVLDYANGNPATAPTISDISDQSTTVNTPTAAIPFTVSDPDTPGINLTLAATSSNPTLVPTNNMVFGGSGTNRTLTVTPAENQLGSATITVQVSDGVLTSSNYFELTVIKQTPMVSILPVATVITYGQALSESTLSGGVVTNAAGASVPGSFAFVVPGDIPTADTAEQAVVYAPIDAGIYNPVVSAVSVTVSKLGLTGSIVAANKVYDGTVGATVVSSNLVGVIAPDAVTLVVGAGSFDNKNVGTRTASAGLSLTGSQAGNYSVNASAADDADITPANLTITAADRTKTYGQTVTFDGATPSTDFSVVGLLGGDTVTSIAMVSAGTGGSSSAPVSGSPYVITPSAADGSGLPNYLITYVTGRLTINPAALTVIAQPQSKSYGAADPTLTYTVSGLQPNDTEAGVLTGALARDAGEAVGGYAIKQGTLSANANYAINFASNTLTIIPTATTILALTINSPTQVVVTWSAISNVIYRVQTRSDLSSAWADLLPDVTATNVTASAVDNPAGAEQRFYRLLVLP